MTGSVRAMRQRVREAEVEFRRRKCPRCGKCGADDLRRPRGFDLSRLTLDERHEPTVENVGGRIRSPRCDSDGTPRGDAHLLLSHPMAPRVLESAEAEARDGGPGLFGFSHVIEADTRRGPNGREIVESILKVVSVDIVASPATVKGLFEQRGGRRVNLVEAYCRAAPPALAGATAALLSRRLSEMGDIDHLDDAGAIDLDADDADELARTLAVSFKDAIAKAADKFLNRGANRADALAEIDRLFKSFLDAAGLDDADLPTPQTESVRHPADAAIFAGMIRESGPMFQRVQVAPRQVPVALHFSPTAERDPVDPDALRDFLARVRE